MDESVAAEQVPDPLGREGGPLEERLTASLSRLRGHVARLRGVPGTEADDLVQEVLARALRYRARFDPARALWPWLRRLAERVQSDQRAASAKRQALLADLDVPPGEPLAREGVGELLEAGDELERLLAPLSVNERAVLVRFHQRGQSVRAIAAALALPEGTVKSHLSRARRKLAGLPGQERPHA